MPNVAIAQAIEVAEHNAWWHLGTLIVFDTLVRDRYYGIRLEVEPGALGRGFIARCYDGVGNRATVWHEDRLTAAQNAYNDYFDQRDQ